MFIQLVDALRCVKPHELTWLVASSDRMIDRDIVRGVLGCPLCHALYPIEHGVADFTAGAAAIEPSGIPADAPDEMAVRVGALLDLIEGGGVVLLAGEWSACAMALGGIVDGVHTLAVDPVPGVTSGSGISVARTASRVPLRPASIRGATLDAAHAGPAYLESVAEALRPGGRLLAPTSSTVPATLTELARDARQWLAEKRGPIVTLERREN